MSVPGVVEAARGWHRPVTGRALLGVSVGLLLVWVLALVTGVWLFYARWQSVISVVNQPMTLRLRDGTQAVAEVLTPVQAQWPRVAPLRLPVDQMVTVSAQDDVQAQVRVQARLPVRTEVHVQQAVPVKTTMALSVPVVFDWLPRLDVQVPIELSLPVDMHVPVVADIPVSLDVHVTGTLPASLDVPLRAALRVRPALWGTMQSEVVSQTLFAWRAPQSPVPMTIESANLRVPFDLTWLRQR